MEKKFIFTLVNYEVGDQIGGIKLIYKVKEANCFKVFNLHIPIKTLKTKELIFLRPSKEVWGITKNKKDPKYLAVNYLGKATNPLLQMWILLERNYTDIRKEFDTTVRIKTLCKEKEYHPLNKLLFECKKYFSLEYNEFLSQKFFN